MEEVYPKMSVTILVSFIEKVHQGNQFKMLTKVFSLGFSPVLLYRISVSNHTVLPLGTMSIHRPLGKMHHSSGQLWSF